MGFHEMSAVSRPVRFTKDDVGVNFWKIAFDGDVAGQ